jgi:dihydrofolate reductase
MEIPLAPVIIVAGLGRSNRVIGRNNGLLWHVPEDLKRFKALTMGHPIIMGRKTFESILAILGKPFPGRTNIVVTRNTDYHYEGVIVVTSFEDALAIASVGNPTEIHIGGGEEIYKQALPYTSRLHLTFYEGEKDGDAFFPEFEKDFVVTKEHEIMESGETKFQWVDLERKKD